MKFPVTSDNVTIVGRTYYHKEILWCGLSGSGVAFQFTGTNAVITLIGDDSTYGNKTEGDARVGIYVNGERLVDTLMDQPEKEFCIFSSKEPEEVTVQVIKLSECAMSTVGIKALELDTVCGPVPLAERMHKIEFIGDSITCGYGVDLEDGETGFQTATEDVTKAYAYKTARNLLADYSMVSYSGYGIISGFTDTDEKVTNQLVPTYYDKVGFSYARPEGMLELQTILWDFESFIPDVIVINLGTNDDSYCQDNVKRRQEFSEAYVRFLKVVREKNKKAHIVCTVGMMGERIYPAVEEAVEGYRRETSDTCIKVVRLSEQVAEDGYVSDYHPTERTHTKAANLLTAKIKEIMKW